MTAVTNYLVDTGSVYIKLDEFYDSFCDEVRLVEELKCQLANNKTIDSFYLDGCFVSVDPLFDGYMVYYGDLRIKLKTEDKMILYMEID